MKKLLLILFIFLSGCATTSDHSQTMRKIESGGSVCMKADNRSDGLIVVRVPSADNVIANKMVVAALKMNSGSVTVDQLVKFLSLPSRPPIFVFGDDNDIVSTTIEMALTRLPTNVERSLQLLCVPDDVQLSPKLRQAAEAAKIELLTVHD
jgi:hypothetical protein